MELGGGYAGIGDYESVQSGYESDNNNADSNAEQAIQKVLADTGDRSNIRGSTNYNPVFAQALNMSRGLQPGNRVAGDYFGADNFRGIENLVRPSYLQPQVPGEKGMYFSQGEKFLQETLPPIIQGVRNISPTGIITNLINQGLEVYDKGKSLYDETFGDTPFRRFNYDNEQKNKSPVGIMENIDRAGATDIQRALMAGYDANPYSRPDLATQTAGLDLKDVQNFVLNSPGVLGKALNYAEPFIQSIVPDTVDVDTGFMYNPEKPDDSYTGIKFTIPFN